MIINNKIWEKIMTIHSYDPQINMGKTKREQPEALLHIMEHKDTYFLNTIDSAVEIDSMMNEVDTIDFSFRYKENESLERNWNNDNGTRQLYKLFNDTLGLRFIIKTSKEALEVIAKTFVDACPFPDIVKVNPHSKDGYQGIHVYIRNKTRVFPIEVQFWTRRDALLNSYLRDTIYTRVNDPEVIEHSRRLRLWLEDIPQLSSDYQIPGYVDYIYEKAFNTNYFEEGDYDE